MPSQKTKFTQWFHVDCIADVHGEEIYSERHWMLIEKYIAAAADGAMMKNIAIATTGNPGLLREGLFFGLKKFTADMLWWKIISPLPQRKKLQ